MSFLGVVVFWSGVVPTTGYLMITEVVLGFVGSLLIVSCGFLGVHLDL